MDIRLDESDLIVLSHLAETMGWPVEDVTAKFVGYGIEAAAGMGDMIPERIREQVLDALIDSRAELEALMRERLIKSIAKELRGWLD